MLRLAVMLIVMCLPALVTLADIGNSDEPLIVTHVRKRLVSTGLDGFIEVVGVNPRGDRVLGKPVAGKDLLMNLKANPMFGKDMVKTSMVHKGSYLSYRQRKNPSLQIIFFVDADGVISYQLDIDFVAPWWDRPFDTLRHAFLETGRNWFTRTIFRKKARTNQQHLAKVLAEEEAQLVAQNK